MNKNLSKRAKALFQRIKDGRFYPAFAEGTPKAMQELLDADLVMTAPRVEVIRLCYVQRQGFKHYQPETWKLGASDECGAE